YNRDQFEKLGIDPEKLETWDQFVEAGKRITQRGGTAPRYMLCLTDNQSWGFDTFFLQRGGDYFNAHGNELLFDDEKTFFEKTVDTLKYYTRLNAGPDRIAANNPDDLQLYTGLADGYYLAILCPDWRSGMLEKNMPSSSGKMALMKLPAFV